MHIDQLERLIRPVHGISFSNMVVINMPREALEELKISIRARLELAGITIVKEDLSGDTTLTFYHLNNGTVTASIGDKFSITDLGRK